MQITRSFKIQFPRWSRKVVPLTKKIGYIGTFDNAHHHTIGEKTMYFAFKRIFDTYSIRPFRYNNQTLWLKRSIYYQPFYSAVALGGGTLINSIPALRMMQEAQRRKLTTFVFGSGVKNPAFWEKRVGYESSLKEWIPTLKQCSFVGVRGPISQQILADNGFPDAKIIGDPALFWTRRQFTKKKKQRRLVLNIGTAQGNVWGKESEIFAFAKRLIGVMHAEGWKVTLYSVSPNDTVLLHDCINATANYVQIFEAYRSIKNTLHFLEHECDCMIGMKLHSVILAICTGTPSIMLEYQPKCRDFMLSMDMDDCTFKTDSLSFDSIVNQLQSMHDNSIEFQNKIRGKVDFYCRQQELTKQYIQKECIANRR